MNTAVRAIIIDDEPDCVKLLSLQLRMYCPNIEVVAECTDSVIAVQRILSLQPDVVFLDIEMPVLNGFQLLEKIGQINFHLIFVTAYDKFAVRAFRFSALDYLLKPIDAKELVSAVSKLVPNASIDPEQLTSLRQNLKQGENSLPNKIALPYQNGVCFVEINRIEYCESENNYTRFHLTDKSEHLVTKTLRDVQIVLEERTFLRVHRQYIVNLNQIKKYVRGDGNYLLMQSGKDIPVARNQKDRLIEKFGWL